MRRQLWNDGWSFRHDPAGSFAGVDVSTRATDPATVLAAHAELSAPGTGQFARILVVQRRHAGGATFDGRRSCRSGDSGRLSS